MGGASKTKLCSTDDIRQIMEQPNVFVCLNEKIIKTKTIIIQDALGKIIRNYVPKIGSNDIILQLL